MAVGKQLFGRKVHCNYGVNAFGPLLSTSVQTSIHMFCSFSRGLAPHSSCLDTPKRNAMRSHRMSTRHVYTHVLCTSHPFSKLALFLHKIFHTTPNMYFTALQHLYELVVHLTPNILCPILLCAPPRNAVVADSTTIIYNLACLIFENVFAKDSPCCDLSAIKGKNRCHEEPNTCP